jgi:hypothetical protein
MLESLIKLEVLLATELKFLLEKCEHLFVFV